MKIAISATGPTLDAEVDPRFGRCTAFVLVETEGMSVGAIPNDSASSGGGAGIQAARRMAGEGVKAVLTGSCGPNAYETLTAAGIEVIVGCSGTVAEVVERFRAGELRRAGAPNAAGHPSPAVGPEARGHGGST